MSLSAIKAFKTQLNEGDIIGSSANQVERPQDIALRLKSEKEGIVVKLGLYKFAVITDVPKFWFFMKKQPIGERNWYAMATEADHKRPWLDFEFIVTQQKRYHGQEEDIQECQEPSALVSYFIQVYVEAFNMCFAEAVGSRLDESDFLWSSDHRQCPNTTDYKFSWHAIINMVRHGKTYLFDNILEEGRFFRFCINHMKASRTDRNALLLSVLKQPDGSVYSRNRAFRLLHCSKYLNDTTAFKVDTLHHQDSTLINDIEHFPIYHQSLGIQYHILPPVTGKRVAEESSVLVGSSPKTTRTLQRAASEAELTITDSDDFEQLRAKGAKPRYRLNHELQELTNAPCTASFSLRSLPDLGSYNPTTGILRSFFRRCPREYDVLRYAEENGLNISQVKPWSASYPDTYIYRFEPNMDKPCPNGMYHHSNGSYIIWHYTSMERTVEMLDSSGLPVSDHLRGFGKLEHICLDPECTGKSAQLINRHYGDHYSLTLTPYWIPVDAIYRVMTLSANITSVITWLIRRLISEDSGIIKLIKTAKCWYIWNGLIWQATNDPGEKISGFLDLYISSILHNFISGSEYWLKHNDGRLREPIRKKCKFIAFALKELLRNVRNVATIQAALTPIEVVFSRPPTLMDGPSSEGWLVVTNKYVNLRTGIFHAPKPDLYISQSISTPWRGAESVIEDLSEPLPNLEHFLFELFGDRNETDFKPFVNNLQTFLGYSLTGRGNLHTVVFLYGSGRNGKGLLCRLLKSTLTETYHPASEIASEQVYDPADAFKNQSNIRSFLEIETIEERLRRASPTYTKRQSHQNINNINIVTNLDKKIICKNARSAENAHTAQLMGLIGARCVLFDELNAREELDLAKFKQYTGGDAIVVRPAYNKEAFVIQHPMFTFIITTNVLPGIAPEPSVTARIKVIQFNVYFDPLMRDDEPETRLRKRGNFNKEDMVKSIDMRCEFLRWLIRGAFNFYKTGAIDWCASIRKDTNEFWGQSDIFRIFLEDKFEIYEDINMITQTNLKSLVRDKYYIKVSEFEPILANYYHEKGTPGNQIIPLQRVYQRLSNEYNVFKLRSSKFGLQRAIYLFGIKLL